MIKTKIKFLVVIVLLIALSLPLTSCKKEEQQTDTRPLVTITLESGETIKLRLYPDAAPVSVENFIKYVEAGFYDGMIFHRIIKNFMIQGGGYYVSEDERLLYKTPLYEAITGEFSDNDFNNPLKHTAGVISMARTGAVNSATSQFFICTDMPESQANYLDGKYAAFGKVADSASLNVVRRLANVQTGLYNDETLGSFENMPVETVRITTISVIS